MSFMLNYNFLDKEVYTLGQIFNFNETDLCETGMPPLRPPPRSYFTKEEAQNPGFWLQRID